MSPQATETVTEPANTDAGKPKPSVPMRIVWNMVALFILLHVSTLIGIYLAIFSAMWKTIVFASAVGLMSMISITVGYHRLWAHRSYKAKLPLRIFLAFWCTVTYELSIYWWVRDHRLHHKMSETHADPYNAKRGFFFSHCGWFMVRKHPDVIEHGKTIDMSDLLADPVIRFQKKYYPVLLILCCFVLPITIPMVFWGESFSNAGFIAVALRLAVSLNAIFLVNSAAHMWGNRPYDETIEPRQNMFVNFGALGEGFHNYHHTFPWDYAASEFGSYFNISTAFIDLMAWLGLAYDRKTVPQEIIRKRAQRTGDGSYDQEKAHTTKYD